MTGRIPHLDAQSAYLSDPSNSDVEDGASSSDLSPNSSRSGQPGSISSGGNSDVPTASGLTSRQIKRPRSGSADEPSSHSGIMRRSSSSALIVNPTMAINAPHTKKESSKNASQGENDRSELVSSAKGAGKSSTAPLPSAQLQPKSDSRITGDTTTPRRPGMIHVDSLSAIPSPHRDPSPGRTGNSSNQMYSSSGRGMKSIVASLSSLLRQKSKKPKTPFNGTSKASSGPHGLTTSSSTAALHKRSKSSELEDSDSDTSSDDATAMAAVIAQANDLGPIGIRQLCLLSAHFQQIVNNPSGADFLSFCGPEKVPFACHSVIFNARWPMLMRENQKVMAEIVRGCSPHEAIILFPTVDPSLFSLVLDYLYTGTFNVTDLTDRKLGLLVDFAKYRKVPGLKEFANSHLLSRQATSKIVNSIHSYVQSSATSGEMLRLDSDAKYEAYMNVLASRAHELVDLPLFDVHQLHRLRRIDMIHLIRRDDFSVNSEVQIFKLVTTWADKTSPNQDQLMENLSFLMAHVRLPLMTMEELTWIDSLGWVPKNLMTEAFKFKETGICTHPTRSKPRKMVLNPYAMEGSLTASSSSLLRFDNLTPTFSSLMSHSSATSAAGSHASYKQTGPLALGGAMRALNQAALAMGPDHHTHGLDSDSDSDHHQPRERYTPSPSSPPLSPLSMTSAASELSSGSKKKKSKRGSERSPAAHSPIHASSSSPLSDAPITASLLEPASPPLVRKERKSKKNTSELAQETASDGPPVVPPLLRSQSDTGQVIPTKKSKRINKSKQDASPLTRADSPPMDASKTGLV